MISLISADLVKKFGLSPDENRKIRINAANSTRMNCTGTVDANGRHRIINTSIALELKVTNSFTNEITIGYKDLKRLQVIDANFPLAKCGKICADEVERIRSYLLKEFQNMISDELSDKPINVPPITIKLKAGPIRPIQCTRARPVDHHFQGPAYDLIKKLQRMKVLSEVDYPTEWVSPAKFVPKANGVDVRLTTNFQQLNKFIERPIHPCLSAHETVRQIDPKAKVFATLDAIMGYFQLELDAVSSDYTTFLTPWGKFKYNRSPMGCSASQDWWNKVSDE